MTADDLCGAGWNQGDHHFKGLSMLLGYVQLHRDEALNFAHLEGVANLHRWVVFSGEGKGPLLFSCAKVIFVTGDHNLSFAFRYVRHKRPSVLSACSLPLLATSCTSAESP